MPSIGKARQDDRSAEQTNAKAQITFDAEGLTFGMDAPLIEHRLVPEYRPA